MSLLLLPPLLLVFGTTILVTHRRRHDERRQDRRQGVVKRASPARPSPPSDVVPTVVVASPSRPAARACWPSRTPLKDIDDPFLVKGVTMAIDGTDPEELRDILESEVVRQAGRTTSTARSSSPTPAPTRPTIGIIGTVMGLVHVLENLAKPEELGHLIAARVRRHPVGRHVRQRDLAAARQPAQAARRARGRPDGADHRGHRRHPGRLQPADHRAEAALAAARRREQRRAEAA